MSEAPAVKVKKEKVNKANKNEVLVLEDGQKIKLHSVAPNIISEVRAKVPDAKMRTYEDKQSGKQLENPAHPEYIAEMKEVEFERQKATLDAFILFGIELLDPIPEDNQVWLEKLVFLNVLTEKEITDPSPMTLELFYKKYVISSPGILGQITTLSGVTEEMLATARESFRSDETRRAN